MNQKRKIGKRIASWLLCMVMVLTMMPITAQAIEIKVIDNVEILGSLPLILCGDKIDPQNIVSNLSVSPTADYKINAAQSTQIDYFENGEWKTGYDYNHDIYTPGTYRLLLCLGLKKPSNETGITFPPQGIKLNGTACGKPTTWFGIGDVAYVYIDFNINNHLYFPRIGSEYNYYLDDVTHWEAECGCGARHNESEHQFEWFFEKEPSEVESGIRAKRCAVCKYVIERMTIEYHEHDWSDEWYHDDNYHWKECTICSKKSEKVKHSRIQTIYLRQPTAIEKGRKCKECLDCGRRYNYEDTTDYFLLEFGISGFHTPVCGETIDINKFFDEAKYSDNGKYQIYPSGQETFLARIDSQTTVAGNAKNYYYNDYMPESTYKVGDYRLCFTLKTADSGSEFVNYKWYYAMSGSRVALAKGGKINDKTVRAYMINHGPEADSFNYIETFYDFTVSHHFVNKECTGCHIKECIATGNHDFSKYIPNGNGTHKVVCKACGVAWTGHDKDACSGETATSTSKAKCTLCGSEYGTNTVGDAPVPGTIEQVEKNLQTLPENGDVQESTFATLQAKIKKTTKSSETLSWKMVPGATKYTVFGNKCGNQYQKLTDVQALTWTQNGLEKGTYYKYIVVASDASGKVLSVSKSIHAPTTGGKYGNQKSIKLSKKKVSLKVGKKVTVKATIKNRGGKVKNHRKLTYESTDTKVATVSNKGKIVAIGAGTCTVYAYAQNGLCASAKVTVK